MAGLEELTTMIYHERQQRGSMLCAQHALNSLLQGNYFTAPDLATIAHSYDALEQGALDETSRQTTSSNMDDTGFFSVQVMEKALEVWGLNLIRWRSEQMRPFQATPQTQLAFVLNLQQHWFTLRRFGPARTNHEDDPGEGHWFNLNSSYPAPKWVSRTYLSMFLQQCEEEGYSVFAVVQADPSKPLALPRTEADTLATTFDAPDSDPGHSSAPAIPGAFPDDPDIIIPDDTEFGLENEDVELQAALQASLTGGEYAFGNDAYLPQHPIPAPPLRQAPPAPIIDDDGPVTEAQSDPVAESMRRNRAIMEQMRRAQEEALRETYEDEVTGIARAQAERRRAELQEEAEAIRRAIAMSAGERGEPIVVDDDDDEKEDPDWQPEDAEGAEGEKENVPARLQRQSVGASAPGPSGATPPLAVGHRVYDDEDAELQAALRASLETMPEGYVHPATPPSRQSTLPAPTVSASAPAPASATAPASTSVPVVNSPTATADDEDGEGTERLSTPPPPPSLDVDEIRRRRLARFGGQA